MKSPSEGVTMRKYITAAAATLLCIFIAPMPAAHAGNMTLTHSSPDDGYDDAFYVKRTNGATAFVYEGGSLSGVTQVYVYGGTRIVCWYAGIGWVVWKDATGWHDAGGSSQSCVNQYD